MFTPGTELAEEFDELAPKKGEKVCWHCLDGSMGRELRRNRWGSVEKANAYVQVIEKKFPGSFAETSLREELKGMDANKLVLTGYMVKPFCLFL